MHNSLLTKAYRISATAILIFLLSLQVMVYVHAHGAASYIKSQEGAQITQDSLCKICEFIATFQKQFYVAVTNPSIPALFGGPTNPSNQYAPPAVLLVVINVVNKGPPSC